MTPKQWRVQLNREHLACAYCVATKKTWNACKTAKDGELCLGKQQCHLCANANKDRFCLVAVIANPDYVLVWGQGGAKTMLPSEN